MKYDSILDTVGRTPIVRLSKLSPPGVSIYAKIESFNPMGSIKDRLALAVIEQAERSGALKPGQTVVEATSGNTGIGLAMVCARKGYPLVIVMAENFSIERRRLMRFLGAKVVLTSAALKGSGMLAKAIELSETRGWFLPRQFENEANADIHSATTAREILSDFEGERLDYWVTTYGTGGTLKGVARALREARPQTRVVVVEPSNSAVLGSGVPQPASAGRAPESHPVFRPHPIQGTSPDFIPKLASDAIEARWIDQTVSIDGADALRLSRELATSEGIFVGISAGAALAGALAIARTAEPGASILCMLPDTGERYLSTPLFESIPVEMTPEELEIARAGAPVVPAPAPSPQTDAVSADTDTERFVAETIADSGQPVVMFALEWCEFCWSVRRLFRALGVQYRSIDLDSRELLQGDKGGKIRSALFKRIGLPTIPQIFIAGEHIGGCSEIFEAALAGDLQRRLRAIGIEAPELSDAEAADLLPKWLPRARKENASAT